MVAYEQEHKIANYGGQASRPGANACRPEPSIYLAQLQSRYRRIAFGMRSSLCKCKSAQVGKHLLRTTCLSPCGNLMFLLVSHIAVAIFLLGLSTSKPVAPSSLSGGSPHHFCLKLWIEVGIPQRCCYLCGQLSGRTFKASLETLRVFGTTRP